jgi:hypothetical protein
MLNSAYVSTRRCKARTDTVRSTLPIDLASGNDIFILLQRVTPNTNAFETYAARLCLQATCPPGVVCAGAAFVYDLFASLDQERK